ncbi:peroxiredoxin-5, mitochondrial isoform X1 [Octopus bimaculoides]|uniref:Peroxiredoxin-5 n=1 Tax=Octopus bimaculoides TaxID=37653 RepID=A0A0L8H8T4_OCTBM|nr:peroxiredoxin-5, mitochondrial isoform X1 [Octopus bimaculoides]|eukprot:XP_014774823.1 PREDICTED: peroxiredoxin-5, mitochondrial-like isoform X1 [Octopus bimaculoides]
MACSRISAVIRCKSSYINGSRRLSTSNPVRAALKVGDAIPSASLFEHNPNTKLNSSELFGSGKHVIFGVPGAFTPTCSESHLPGYIEKHNELKKKGIVSINCVAVNDPFVMKAWGEAHNATGKIRMLADIQAEFTKALGLEIDLSAVLGNVRSKRYAMVVENGIVKHLLVEPSGIELTCSAANKLMSEI